MHVLVLPSWYPANSEDVAGSFFREQAIALARAGMTVGVVVVCLRSLRRPLRALFGPFGVRVETDDNVKTIRFFSVQWFPKIRVLSELHDLVLGIIATRLYIRKFGRPDLIHVQSMLNAGLVAKWAKKKYGIPYVVTEHSSAFHNVNLSRRQIRVAARIVRHAAGLSAVSKSLVAVLSRVLNADRMRWHVIPNMVSAEFLASPLYEKASEGDRPYTFITVSYLKPGKRVGDILRAFAIAFTFTDNVRLRIVGDGECKGELVALANDLDMRDKFLFEGPRGRESVAALMRDSDVYVLASESETFGVVLVEALASGIPVIATRCGGAEDIVTESDGMMIDIGDIQKLALCMRDIMGKTGNYDSNALRTNCERRYSEGVVTRQLVSFYSSALRR